MATIILLNVAFAALVVAAILTVLTWGIVDDHKTARHLTASRRVAQRVRGRRGAQALGAPLRHTA
jgi:hypothetical protein